MKNLISINIAPNGGFTGFGRLGLEQGGASGALGTFTSFVSSAIGLMTIIAFIWFVFNFLIGAIGIMIAGGDKQKLENSRQKIVNGIIGIVVVISAMAIISLIGYIFGVDILNLPALFSKVTS